VDEAGSDQERTGERRRRVGSASINPMATTAYSDAKERA
jgi:hypothetical protein